ncbi:MAG: hypothetical protein JSR67_06825 [Proteobacteria bacterium]|nr:hypothetical protein [Pseudomonadota bacterium]
MNLAHTRYVLAGFFVFLLAACGGGGGGGGATAVSVDKASVAVSASVVDATVGTPTVTLTISNATGGSYYVSGATSHNGVATLSPGIFSATSAVVQIHLKTPYTLAPATYTDSVQLAVCTDQACTQQISGSPVTVKVSYTVNPAPAGAQPAMTVSTNALSLQALPGGAAPPAGFSVAIANAPSFALTAKVTQTSNAVVSATIDPPTPIWNTPPQGGFGVDITLKSPSQLPAGVYKDQVTVVLCLDPACVNPLAGSPQTITIAYVIGNSVPGAYTVSQVAVEAVDLVADGTRGLLYAAVPASAAAHPSSIAVIDPVNAVITSYVAMGFDPGKLALSADGGYLYVGEHNGPRIARLVLPGMTLDATITLANDAHGQVTWPIDIKVQPGSPKTIAVARDFKNDTQAQGDGVVIYDDTVPRAQIAGLDAQGNANQAIGWLSWGSSAATLYGSGFGEIATLAVSASGAQVSASATPGNVGRIQYIGGVIYADSGALLDPTTLMASAVLPAPSYPAIAVTADGSIKRVYKITTTGGVGTYLNQYDADTLALQGHALILGVYNQYLVESDFMRWGSNGLAFLATSQQAAINAPNDQIVLISGPFVVQ